MRRNIRGRVLMRSYSYAVATISGQINALMKSSGAPPSPASHAAAILLLEHGIDLLKAMNSDSIAPQDFYFDHLIESSLVGAIEAPLHDMVI
jgi:hypothetical protein